MVFFFFKQKTAYEMRISDWSSDVCSSDLTYGSCMAWRTAKGKDPTQRHRARPDRTARAGARRLVPTFLQSRRHGTLGDVAGRRTSRPPRHLRVSAEIGSTHV